MDPVLIVVGVMVVVVGLWALRPMPPAIALVLRMRRLRGFTGVLAGSGLVVAEVVNALVGAALVVAAGLLGVSFFVRAMRTSSA